MVSIFSNARADFPLDGPEREGLFTIEQVRDLISLKTRMSKLHPAFEYLDEWPLKIKSFETMEDAEVKLLKPTLPAVVFAAKMRNRYDAVAGSGLFCVDIDYDDNKNTIDTMGMRQLKDYVSCCLESSVMLFTSPSRKGLKVVHRISTTGHLEHGPSYTFGKIFDHFSSAYSLIGINIDPKCRDPFRLCFLSYDRDLVYNSSVKAESIDIPQKPEVKIANVSGNRNGYKLGGNKTQCPSCKQARRLRPYVDENGYVIEGTGLCDRSNSCGFNKRPSDVYPDRKWYLKIS